MDTGTPNNLYVASTSSMPILCEFDTRTIHAPANPQADTRATVCFPRPLIAPPHLPHGIRMLDVGKNAAIRIKSTISYFADTWADCHITTWHDSTLYWGPRLSHR